MHPAIHQDLVRLHREELERRVLRATPALPSRPAAAPPVRARLRPLAFRLLGLPAAPTPRAGTC